MVEEEGCLLLGEEVAWRVGEGGERGRGRGRLAGGDGGGVGRWRRVVVVVVAAVGDVDVDVNVNVDVDAGWDKGGFVGGNENADGDARSGAAGGGLGRILVVGMERRRIWTGWKYYLSLGISRVEG